MRGMTLDSFLAFAAIVALTIVGLAALFTHTLTALQSLGVIALALAALAIARRSWVRV